MNVRNLEQRRVMSKEISDIGVASSISECSNSMSAPGGQEPKSVAFELIFTTSPQHRARIPMRVQIFPHDTTDSIVTTVKNFYGLYSSPNFMKGVSFEDEEGNILIARYENFRNNMIVYVRVINEPISPAEVYGSSAYLSGPTAIQKPYIAGETHPKLSNSTQAFDGDHNLSRPIARATRKHTSSPNQSCGRHDLFANSVSVKKIRSRSGLKGRGCDLQGNSTDNYLQNNYSNENDNTGTILAKTKSEQIGSTEISLDNIVEGGRRKRAKFESSELPLFAPTQMPAATSNSSISPACRLEHQRPIIYTHTNSQHPFFNPQLLKSPQGIQNGFGQSFVYNTPGTENRRIRGDPSNRLSMNSTPSCNSSGIIPTPDPTVGSCMSEEDKDVALQLMRLGELSNISHGRTSASTLDDTFSGKADTTSSTGATSECESENEFGSPATHKVKREISPVLSLGLMNKLCPHAEDNPPSHDSAEPSCDDGEYDDRRDETFKVKIRETSGNSNKSTLIKSKNQATVTNKPRGVIAGAKSKTSKLRAQRTSHSKNKRSTNTTKPISPTSLPPLSRKTSNSSSTLNLQQNFADDEEDLSSKPRCQRCRKSKKGCDRQRPCQRCKDAGLSADQCVSEDEGNGRKGRYGRHMGVSVKKDENTVEKTLQSSVTNGNHGSPNKKRKR